MNSMITIAKNSNNPEFVDYAYRMGVRFFRFNMDYETEAIESINMMESLQLNDVELFGDFQGVKMRVQLPKNMPEVPYQEDDTVIFWRASNKHPHIKNIDLYANFIKVGTILGFSDNRIIGEIIEIDQEKIRIRIVKSTYPLRQNSGCNLIGSDLSTPRMTPEICNLIAPSEVIRKKKIDWVILSFVETPEDIRDFVGEMHNIGIKVMAKVETPSGVDNLIRISSIVDGIMIGRGDLSALSGDKYPKIYDKALASLSSIPDMFSGIGTFFLANYSQTGELDENELKEIEDLKRKNIKFVMLSKEVVNSNFPYETLNLLQSI